MKAVFENGVFRPLEPIDLPEGSEVEFEPRLESSRSRMIRELGHGDLPEFVGMIPPITAADEDERDPQDDPHNEHMNAIYNILSRSYETGETDLAARHNEHQP